MGSLDRQKTSIHVTAVDGIAKVNSLFTMASIIGFSLTNPSAATVGAPPSCNAGITTVRRVIVLEVVSFSFFLFSSLIAQSVKLIVNLSNSLNASDPHKGKIDPSLHRYALFASAMGSVLGFVFMMLSIVGFIEVKLGVLSCGGEQVYAIVTLIVFVASAILGYVITTIYAAFVIKRNKKNA